MSTSQESNFSYIADTLSRAPLTEKVNELEYKQYDINVLHMLPICEIKLDLIKKKTEEDGTLTEIMTTVKNGWLSNKADVAPGAKPYWNYRDEITHHSGAIQWRKSNHPSLR